LQPPTHDALTAVPVDPDGPFQQASKPRPGRILRTIALIAVLAAMVARVRAWRRSRPGRSRRGAV
jgi:hypothetical protein